MKITKRRNEFIAGGYSESMADVLTLAYIDGLRTASKWCSNYFTPTHIGKTQAIKEIRKLTSDVTKAGHALMSVMKQEKEKNEPTASDHSSVSNQ